MTTMTIITCDPLPAATPVPAPVDFTAVKTRQQATWASGDYAVIGRTLQIVGETLCEAADLRAGERVLDVACGNGNATLAAARRFAEVTGLDYVPALLEGARARAEAEGMPLALVEGDAEDMPLADASFDVVLSTFGCMFTPDQERTAREMARVCRPGGRIAMANWTPEGFIGQLFKVIGGHVPPPAGVRSPALWGSESRLVELFAGAASRIEVTRKHFVFRYLSAAHWIEIFRRYYGPVEKAFAAVGAEREAALDADLRALIARFARGGESLVVPGEYLEVVVHRA
jgi:SAM-dependent methyltransferase